MPPKKTVGNQKGKKRDQRNEDEEAEYLLKMQLIELVQGYPEIYDIQDPHHHKQYLRNAAWEAIAEALFIPGTVRSIQVL